MITEKTSQHIDFNEWLNQCPVQWYRQDGLTSEDTVMYEFIFDYEEEEEDS